jgi:hypothetical protein
MTIRHTRATEPVLQKVFHAKDSYDTVGKINLDCSRVSTIEIILATVKGDMKGAIVTIYKDSNDDTGPRRIILASERET